MKKLAMAILCVCCIASCAFASTTPAIRLQMPSSAKAGETITVQLVVEAAAQDKISAVTAALKWNTQQLEAVGNPVLKNDILREQLAAKYDNAKGISEIAGASMSQAVSLNKQDKFVFAEQQFKLSKNVKSGDSVKLSFTTDKRISGGTECIVSDKVTPFAIITGANLQVK